MVVGQWTVKISFILWVQIPIFTYFQRLLECRVSCALCVFSKCVSARCLIFCIEVCYWFSMSILGDKHLLRHGCFRNGKYCVFVQFQLLSEWIMLGTQFIHLTGLAWLYNTWCHKSSIIYTLLEYTNARCVTRKILISINQSIFFLIKRYIINALSAVQWNTHISLNTYIYIYSEIQHTYKHSYKAAISAQIQCFLFQAHTLSHSSTLRAARAFLILGNPSLVLKSPPGVPPSTFQPLQHHSRPTLNSAAHGAAFSLQVETNPDLLRDRQAG